MVISEELLHRESVTPPNRNMEKRLDICLNMGVPLYRFQESL